MKGRPTLEALLDHARALGATVAGLALVRHILTTPQHRVVRASPFNGTTSFPSEKTGRMLYGESISVEGPWYRIWDDRDSVLWIVDQPDAPISLAWPADEDGGARKPVTIR